MSKAISSNWMTKTNQAHVVGLVFRCAPNQPQMRTLGTSEKVSFNNSGFTRIRSIFGPYWGCFYRRKSATYFAFPPSSYIYQTLLSIRFKTENFEYSVLAGISIDQKVYESGGTIVGLNLFSVLILLVVLILYALFRARRST